MYTFILLVKNDHTQEQTVLACSVLRKWLYLKSMSQVSSLLDAILPCFLERVALVDAKLVASLVVGRQLDIL